MTVSSEITQPNEDDFFKEIPFYDKPIEKPKIKHLKDIEYQLNSLFLSN